MKLVPGQTPWRYFLMAARGQSRFVKWDTYEMDPVPPNEDGDGPIAVFVISYIKLFRYWVTDWLTDNTLPKLLVVKSWNLACVFVGGFRVALRSKRGFLEIPPLGGEKGASYGKRIPRLRSCVRMLWNLLKMTAQLTKWLSDRLQREISRAPVQNKYLYDRQVVRGLNVWVCEFNYRKRTHDTGKHTKDG